MTLRDLTPRQTYLLVCKCKSRFTFWSRRPPGLGLKDQRDSFQKGFNEGAKAILELLTNAKRK